MDISNTRVLSTKVPEEVAEAFLALGHWRAAASGLVWPRQHLAHEVASVTG